MTADQFAAAHNLPLASVRSLLAYLEQAIERASPEQLALIRANTREFVETGVRNWFERGNEFYSRLLYGTDEASIALRSELAHAVWTEIRKEKGLPT